MTVIFRCNRCGMDLQAGERQCNTMVSCPKCRSTIMVPPPAVVPPPVPSNTSRGASNGHSSSLFPVIVLGAGVPLSVALILLLIYHPLAFVSALAMLIGFAVLGTLYVFLVKSHAFSNHLHDVPLFCGLVRLVLWEPTEGVVLLQNKQIMHVDNNVEDGGGARFLFPILGQEIGLVAPLTVQPVQFEDANVYTRDSIPLSMKMTIWWKVRDLERFYLSLSQEVHALTERGRQDIPNNADGFSGPMVTWRDRHRLGAAERWITASAEEETRAYTCGISTSLLVAEQIAASLPNTNVGQITAEQANDSRGDLPLSANSGALEASLGLYQTASGALSERLRTKLNSVLGTKGLEIDRVALQEVGLPPAVRKKAIDAAAAWYGVIEARRKGIGATAQVDELAKVIGKDAVATAEILKHYQGINIGVGLTGVLDQVFTKFAQAMK